MGRKDKRSKGGKKNFILEERREKETCLLCASHDTIMNKDHWINIDKLFPLYIQTHSYKHNYAHTSPLFLWQHETMPHALIKHDEMKLYQLRRSSTVSWWWRWGGVWDSSEKALNMITAGTDTEEERRRGGGGGRRRGGGEGLPIQINISSHNTQSH